MGLRPLLQLLPRPERRRKGYRSRRGGDARREKGHGGGGV
ncbi:Hypothetical protein AA314_02921 [Archangium gephyra]|uniref:Uncharacterized protein n=1 Tax=Archangium gephyra TaxID=48 RepID=A0AAC8Q591_9BACT|nr:Hypothetical protein AA314_02921 [Archangium gephyra]